MKNRAVTAKKVAANTLTGANINASTLGTVPNAVHATSAGNADKLGGLFPSAIQARISGGCGAGESVASVTQGGDVNCVMNGGPPSGPAGGSLSGTYPNPTIASKPVVASAA